MEPNNSQKTPPAAPASPEQSMRIVQDKISMYYSNCAMLATTPVDISLYFGRLIPVNKETGEQALAEYYERQIVVTVEQAKKIGHALIQTVQLMEASRNAAVQQAPGTAVASAPQAPAVQHGVPASKSSVSRGNPDLDLEIPLEDLEQVKQQPVQGTTFSSRSLAAAQAGTPQQAVPKTQV